jgi:hypothetical protein
MPAEAKAQQLDDLFAIRIAYQTPIQVRLPKTGAEVEVLPNTFEDSFVLSNAEHFSNKAGRGLVRAFARALKDADSAEALGSALFEELRDGDKAGFALLVLGDSEFASLTVPEYISEGLAWLQAKLERKQKELLVVPAAATEVTP